MTSPHRPQPSTAEAPDAELARRVGAGRGAAVGDHVGADAEAELCRRLLPRVAAFARRHLRDAHAAADLTQHVMAITVQKLREGALERPEQVASFVLGIARNTLRDHLRGEARWQRRHAGGDAAAEPAVAPGGGAALVGDDDAPDPERVQHCLERLAERERTVVLLTFFDQLAAPEIGARLGLSGGNVRVVRSRALGRLRDCLGLVGTLENA